MKVLKENKLNEMENVVKVYNFNDKNYMKIEPQGFLTLDLKSLTDDWDKGILINTMNLYHIVNGFGKLLENMRDPKLYGLAKNGKLILYADQAKSKTVEIFNIGGQQKILLIPTIVYDEIEQSYEGCRLIINNTENYIDLTIDALESIYYTLSKIDIFTYTAHLYNMYLATLEKMDIKSISMPTRSSKKHVLLDNIKEDEVQCNLPKPEVPNSKFFDFNFDN